LPECETGMRGDGGMFDLQKLGAVLLEQKTKYTPNKNVPMYRRKSFRGKYRKREEMGEYHWKSK